MIKEIVTYEIAQELYRLGYYEFYHYYNAYNKHLFTTPMSTHGEGFIAPNYENACEWIKKNYKIEPIQELLLETLKTL
jgi:hypothetical protein